MKLGPVLALIAVIIVWSITPSLVRAFALETGARDSIPIRMVANALFSMPMLVAVGMYIERADWPRLAIISFIGSFGYYVGSIYGFANLSAGAGGIVFATNPIMIAALAIAIGLERISIAIILGLLICFAGTVYLFIDGLDDGGKGNPVFGGAMMLACCACWTIYVVFAKRLIVKYGPLRITLWSTALCALPALAFATTESIPIFLKLSEAAFLGLAFLTLVGTIFGASLWNYASGHLRPTSVGLALYLLPPGTSLFGWLLLKEPTGVKTLIGGLIILIGVAVAEFGKSFKLGPT